MYNFDEYTIVVFQTEAEYHKDIPEHKFCAHLKEISPSGLRAYGESREKAIMDLKEQFEEVVKSS